MTFYEERIRHLLRLFADNKATEPQIRELLTLLQQKEGDRELESFMLALRLEPNNNTFQLSTHLFLQTVEYFIFVVESFKYWIDEIIK